VEFPDQTIVELFRERSTLRAEQVVIAAESGAVTFGELDRLSDRIAGALAIAGIEPGERVALLAINGPEFAAAYLGILKAGAVVLPVNVLLNPHEVDFILDDAAAVALLYHPALAETVAVLEAKAALKLVSALGDSDWAALTDHHHTVPSPALDPKTDLAALLYTSGTTGHPKGAMLTHRNLVSNTFSIVGALHLEPGRDRLLVVLPMFHAFAATVGLLTPLLHGLSLVPLPRFEPSAVAAAIARHGATVFLGVPSMYNLLLRLGEEAGEALRGLRFCISGGAALPGEVRERFEARFGVPVHEGDGPTECSPVTCVNPVGGPRRNGSVGVPVPGVEMRIADEAGRTLADGEVGEICVRGPNVMMGYWAQPEATRESFFGDWFRTGDLGYREPDGYFYMVDRKKDLIIVNGMNVYPRVVEEVLYTHPQVREAAVVGEPHKLHGEIPVAYVALHETDAVDAATLRTFCQEYLGRYEVPRHIYFMDELPKSAAGKILKRALRREGELERGVDHAVEVLPQSTEA
jgi:long-chain acyl-CoA synthetase